MTDAIAPAIAKLRTRCKRLAADANPSPLGSSELKAIFTHVDRWTRSLSASQAHDVLLDPAIRDLVPVVRRRRAAFEYNAQYACARQLIVLVRFGEIMLTPA